jgi:PncC family amidohydrolase
MIAKSVYKKLVKNGLTIAFSESITGGSVSFEMVKIPGASKVFLGSIVSYQESIKKDVLGVSNSCLKNYDLVSKEVAIEMAKQTSIKFKSDLSVGITGNAGPTFQKGEALHKAIIACVYLGEIYVYEIKLENLTRVQAIKKTTQFVYLKCDELIA